MPHCSDRAFRAQNARAFAALETIEARDYKTLLAVFNGYRIRQGKTMEELDFEGNFADHHASKIFCGIRNLGHVSLGKMCLGLRVKIIVVPFDE